MKKAGLEKIRIPACPSDKQLMHFFLTLGKSWFTSRFTSILTELAVH